MDSAFVIHDLNAQDYKSNAEDEDGDDLFHFACKVLWQIFFPLVMDIPCTYPGIEGASSTEQGAYSSVQYVLTFY